jgi:hypothetical protein
VLTKRDALRLEVVKFAVRLTEEDSVGKTVFIIIVAVLTYVKAEEAVAYVKVEAIVTYVKAEAVAYIDIDAAATEGHIRLGRPGTNHHCGHKRGHRKDQEYTPQNTSPFKKGQG